MVHGMCATCVHTMFPLHNTFTAMDLLQIMTSLGNRIHYSMYRIELAMTCSVCHSDLTMVGTYIRAEVGSN